MLVIWGTGVHKYGVHILLLHLPVILSLDSVVYRVYNYNTTRYREILPINVHLFAINPIMSLSGSCYFVNTPFIFTFFHMSMPHGN